MKIKDINEYCFESSPLEITRHNWCLAKRVDGNKLFILHYCDDESYVDGLLIDDLWWENNSGEYHQEIHDIYLLKNGLYKKDDFELPSYQTFFCKAIKITKQFLFVNELDDDNRGEVIKYERNLSSRYVSSCSAPVLSVITTVYNNAVLLEQTIQSVINQKADRVEYVIKDACSTDDFDKVVERYKKYGIQVIKSKDKGIYDGMDQGFKAAKGIYIQILNSDDVFYNSDVSDKYIEAIEQKTSDVFCSNIIMCLENGERVIRKPDLSKLRFQSSINHTSLVMRYDDYCKLGGFDKKMKIAADCDLTIKIVKADLKIKQLPIICVCFRMGGASSDTSWRQLREGLVCRFRYSALNIPGYFFTIIKFIKKKFF